MVMSDEKLPVILGNGHKTYIKTYCPRNLSQIGVARFTYKELERVTNNFARRIGCEAFATIYHGCFKDGTLVQIKLYKHTWSEQFWKEVDILAQLKHKNIIPLIGYCNEGKHCATVFNEMPEENLSDKLRGESSSESLSWKLRLKIALGAAKGLEYLHTQCVPPVIHIDLPSRNILLDHKLEAKLSSFELCALSNELECAIRGTFGYMDPEYFRTGKPSIMSDVYSFGVVLLELITGRALFLRGSNDQYLVDWALERAKDRIENIVDAKLREDYDASSVGNILTVAIQCTSFAAVDRPTITDVISQLEISHRMEATRLRKQKKDLLRMR